MTFFFALLIKHAIIDLGVQSHVKGLDKTRYFSNAHIHYLHHGISTLLIALFFLSPQLAKLSAIFDYFANWNIDFNSIISTANVDCDLNILSLFKILVNIFV